MSDAFTNARDGRSSVLVLGAAGFIGRHVTTAARNRGISVEATVRRPSAAAALDARVLNLQDAAALRAAMREATAVVHAISYVGSDAQEARRTNALGTRSVVEAAAASGSPRLVYVSTASVVGSGPHRGAAARFGDQHPESAASSTRAEAEQMVMAYGGTVVRPNLVYGPGDRWFVPRIIRLLRASTSDPRGWTALVSTLHVRDLAAGIVALTQSAHLDWEGRNVFMNSNRPTRMRDIASTIEDKLLDAEDRLTSPPTPSPDSAELSPHQWSLLTEDNWFDSESAWETLNMPAPPGFSLGAEDLRWYRGRT